MVLTRVFYARIKIVILFFVTSTWCMGVPKIINDYQLASWQVASYSLPGAFPYGKIILQVSASSQTTLAIQQDPCYGASVRLIR
jgi:hypothetical protein